MVPPIPIENRERILKLRQAGHSFRDIREILIREHGVTYSVIGIGNCYQKIVRNGGLLESQPKQKYSKDLLEKIKSELQSILESNSYLTGQQQIEEIRHRLGISISMDAVGRYRRMLGWRVLPSANDTEQSSAKKKPVRVSDASLSSCNSSTTSYSDEANSSSFSACRLNAPPLAPIPATNPTTLPAGHSVVHSVHQLTDNSLVKCETLPIGHQYQADFFRLAHAPVPSIFTMGIQQQQQNLLPATVISSGCLAGGQVSSQVPMGIAKVEAMEGDASMLNGTPMLQQAPLVANDIATQSPLRFGPQHVFTSKSFIKSGSPSNFKYQVWAGISNMGATSICIWDADCRVKSSFYCETILSRFFLPFRAERYATRSCVLVQNNDTIYRSNEARQFMIENGIEYETWSQDKYRGVNNPIELVWEDINSYVRTEVKPKSLDELRESICIFWATKMTDSRCRSYLRMCALYSDH